MGLPQNLHEDLAGIQSLAASVMEQVRARLYVELRFLDRALFGLQPTPVLTFPTLGSDGTHLFYNPAYVIGRWTDGKNELCRDILHTALHFVFRHPFVGSNTNLILWDIAVDVAVEAAITDLSMPCLTSMFEPGEAGFLSLLREHVPQLTAERIYAFLKDGGVQPPLLGEMAAAFRRDSHEHWYTSQQASFDNDPLRPSQWEQIRRRAQQELSLQQKAYGNKSRGLLLNMREATREKVDYRTFLQKFTHRAEVLHLSDEEFDPILYTYGLNTYGCLPLIEPLEFRDEKRLSSFCIALDTSGSCSESLSIRFLQHTCQLLLQNGTLFRRFHLHILQCDAAITGDTVIRTREELPQKLASIRLRGGGGTDFRPVFTYIKELMKNDPTFRPQGLLYFTDGKGRFPQTRPPYPTAFVFLREDDDPPMVPPWAMAATWRQNELIEQWEEGAAL